MNKIALYTVNLGGYDKPIPVNPAFVKGIDLFAFSDQKYPDNFTTIPTQGDIRYQRSLKICVPAELLNYDMVIYIDANVEIIRPIQGYLRYHKGEISVKVHPKRNCVYQEGFACIEQKKADPKEITDQLHKILDLGVKAGSGMYETNVIIRTGAQEFCKEWSNQLKNGTHRDQIAIIPAREITGTDINAIPYSAYQQHFKTHPHVNREPVAVHYIQPYSINKKFGQSINQAIERIEAGTEDWFVLMDYDAMFMTPDFGRHISEIIIRNRDKYQLIGCMTNRIRADHQKVKGMFDEMNIRKHAAVAKELEANHWGEVIPCSGVAGFCMMFPKKVWEKVKFNDSLRFDTEFNDGVKRQGGKVGIATGLYMFHQYRILSKDPLNETNHLK